MMSTQSPSAVPQSPHERYRWKRPVIRALGVVDKCTVLANGELGHVPPHELERILRAAQDVIDGRVDDTFPLATLHTSPPTAIHIAVVEQIANVLVPAIRAVRAAIAVYGAGALLDDCLDRLARDLRALYPLTVDATTARYIAHETGKPFVSVADEHGAPSAHEALVDIAAVQRKLAGALLKASPTRREALTSVAVQVYGTAHAVALAGSERDVALDTYRPSILFGVIDSAQLVAEALTAFVELDITLDEGAVAVDQASPPERDDRSGPEYVPYLML